MYWRALPALLLLAAAPTIAQDEETAVRQLFDRYKGALLAGDGALASELVDAETLEYFDEIKTLVLAGDAEAVRQRDFVDRLLIVAMRHEIPPDELAEMDLEGLLQHAVDAGWIGKQAIVQLGIGAVDVQGDEASAEAVVGGLPPEEGAESEELRYRFVREQGDWKFRFHSLVAGINTIISRLSAQMGTDEDDLIFLLVEQLSGRKVLPEVWGEGGEEAAPGSSAASAAP
jgi:hypothetical protein